MDTKQRKKLLNSTYKALSLISFLSLGWVVYLAIDKIVGKSGILWLDITLICVCGLVLMFLALDANKTRRLKNKYGTAKYLFFIVFNTLVGIIAGGFVFYYKNIDIKTGYIFAICLVFAVEIICILIFTIGLRLSRLSQNTNVSIDSNSRTPNYDDELYLKKKLNELNRKLEMKKVQEKIDRVQKELDNK